MLRSMGQAVVAVVADVVSADGIQKAVIVVTSTRRGKIPNGRTKQRRRLLLLWLLLFSIDLVFVFSLLLLFLLRFLALQPRLPLIISRSGSFSSRSARVHAVVVVDHVVGARGRWENHCGHGSCGGCDDERQ